MIRRLAVACTVALALAFGAALMVRAFVPVDIGSALSRHVETITSRPVSIAGKVDLLLLPRPRIVAEDIAFAGSATTDAVPLLTAPKLTAELRFWPLLIGRIRTSGLAFDRPRIRVFRDAAGNSNFDLYDANAFDAVSVANPRIGTITLRNGRFDFTDRANGRRFALDDLDATIGWRRFLTDVDVAGSAIYNGRSVHISLSAGRPVNLLFGGTSRIVLDFSNVLAQGQLTGLLRAGSTTDLRGTLSLSASDFPALAGWAGVDARGRLMPRALDVNGTVAIRRRAIVLDAARFSFAGQAAEGALSIDLAPGTPAVKGTLAFDTLDVDALVAGGVPRANVPALAADVFEPRDLSRLDQTIDLRVSATDMSVGGLAMANVALALIVKDGRADLGLGTADFANGTVVGGVVLETGPNRPPGSSVTLSTRGVDIFPVLESIGGLGWIEGPVDAEVDVGAIGGDWTAVRRTLSGTMRIVVSNGAIRLPERVSLVAPGLPGVVGTIAQQSLRRRAANLPFTQARAEISLAGGVARFTDIDVTSDRVRLSGSGRVALADGRLDFELEAGPETAAVPVTISGTMAEPVVAGDIPALARLVGPR